MTTEETRRSTSYSRIVTNLLALRDEVRETNHKEAEALERIVIDVTALQLRDSCVAEMSTTNRRKTDSTPSIERGLTFSENLEL